LTEQFRGQRASDRDVANPTWLAPEILSGKPNGTAGDVYAFGSTIYFPSTSPGPILLIRYDVVMMWEVLTRDHSLKNFKAMVEQENASIKGTRPEIPANTNTNFAALMAY